LNFFREVPLKEVFLIFTDSVFIKETIKYLIRVSGLVSRVYDFSLDGSESPEVDFGRSEKSTGEEERIIQVKEMSKESSAHGI
jgi:hypothetical protein